MLAELAMEVSVLPGAQARLSDGQGVDGTLGAAFLFLYWTPDSLNGKWIHS
jgi:hypothetical protein